nr:sugar tyrosine-protein kinase [Azospirillum soli]
MEDTRVTLLALGLLVVALVVILGSVVLSPSTLVLLATLGAWINLTYLVAITLKR